jgi:methyltransferase
MVTSLPAYFVFLGLIALERGVELRLSRRNARIAFTRGGREYGQAHFRTMAVFHGAFLASCAAEVTLLHRPFPGVLGAIALFGALAAQALRYWAIATLGERWNVRIIVVSGEEPITAGPYRFIRHPNYAAVALEMACVPLVHGAWLTAILFSLGNAALLRTRIREEEKALGGHYAAAFADRPRFLPRFHRGA